MRAFRWTLIGLWMGFLAYLSLGRGYPPAIEGALRMTGTTVLHFAGYGVLSAALGWALGGRARRLVAAAALAFAYGGALEALQLLVPARTADWADLGVNLAGAVTGTVVSLLAIRVSRRAQRGTQLSPDRDC